MNDRNKILYVGFKGKNNASFKLVNELKGDHLFLTNSFRGLFQDIHLLNKEYKKILMFGTDKKLVETIRLERVAQKDGEVVRSLFDITDYIRSAREMNLSCIVSDLPTDYLCNEAYFLMMRKVKCPVLFVHIPGLGKMSEIFYEKMKLIFNEEDPRTID